MSRLLTIIGIILAVPVALLLWALAFLKSRETQKQEVELWALVAGLCFLLGLVIVALAHVLGEMKEIRQVMLASDDEQRLHALRDATKSKMPLGTKLMLACAIPVICAVMTFVAYGLARR